VGLESPIPRGRPLHHNLFPAGNLMMHNALHSIRSFCFTLLHHKGAAACNSRCSGATGGVVCVKNVNGLCREHRQHFASKHLSKLPHGLCIPISLHMLAASAAAYSVVPARFHREVCMHSVYLQYATCCHCLSMLSTAHSSA
jgi:hypothetical protein